jgi:hypothetical protein
MREYLDDADDITDTVVPPGGSVRVRTFLTDAVRFEDGEPRFVRASDGADLSHHQPGYRLGDAASKSVNLQDLNSARDAARAARSAWIRKISDAWRTPAREVAGATGQNKTDPDQINRSALSHEPDNSSSLAEWREHSGGPDDEPDHDIDAVMRRHQRQRDDAWARYRDNLQNAWQRGRTDPREADRITRQGERWRGGR